MIIMIFSAFRAILDPFQAFPVSQAKVATMVSFDSKLKKVLEVSQPQNWQYTSYH